MKDYNEKNESAKDVLLESLLTGDTSSSIRNQEKRGQHGFLNSINLPREGLIEPKNKAIAEELGIQIVDDGQGSDLFCTVKLPKGWAKRATDHSMWSELLDDKGRVRAMIGYKAAYYDQWARLSWNSFIKINNYAWNSLDSDFKTAIRFGNITDANGNVLYESRKYDPANYEKSFFACDALKQELYKWVEENYPDHRNPTAYWANINPQSPLTEGLFYLQSSSLCGRLSAIDTHSIVT